MINRKVSVGDIYVKIGDYWRRKTWDSKFVGYVTKREINLLEEIIRLEDAIKEAVHG